MQPDLAVSVSVGEAHNLVHGNLLHLVSAGGGWGLMCADGRSHEADRLLVVLLAAHSDPVPLFDGRTTTGPNPDLAHPAVWGAAMSGMLAPGAPAARPVPDRPL